MRSASTSGMQVDSGARARVGGRPDTSRGDLADRHLRHGLIAAGDAQLKTITLGGAGHRVSASNRLHCAKGPATRVASPPWRFLTGREGVKAKQRGRACGPVPRGFPNSYGTLGYAFAHHRACRLPVAWRPLSTCVTSAHTKPAGCMRRSPRSPRRGNARAPSDFRCDGTAFGWNEISTWNVGATAKVAPWAQRLPPAADLLPVGARARARTSSQPDYLWRWTPMVLLLAAVRRAEAVVRKVVARRYRRSDVYRRWLLRRPYHNLPITSTPTAGGSAARSGC